MNRRFSNQRLYRFNRPEHGFFIVYITVMLVLINKRLRAVLEKCLRLVYAVMRLPQQI